MKYFALDIETLGLDPNMHSVLQIAAVEDDTLNQKPLDQLRKFNVFISNVNFIGNQFALEMHLKTGLLQRWLESKDKRSIDYACQLLCSFLGAGYTEGTKINLAGKNIGKFDIQFLVKSPIFETFLNSHISHRFIDPADKFTNYILDSGKPNLSECKRRACIIDTEVKHDALEDCYDVVKLIRFLSK